MSLQCKITRDATQFSRKIFFEVFDHNDNLVEFWEYRSSNVVRAKRKMIASCLEDVDWIWVPDGFTGFGKVTEKHSKIAKIMDWMDREYG